MDRSQWKKAFFLTLEYLGVFAVVFAFLLFFRPARFLAKYLSQKPPEDRRNKLQFQCLDRGDAPGSAFDSEIK